MADLSPVETMLNQLEIKFTKEEVGRGSVKYTARFSNKKCAIITSKQQCTVVVSRLKKLTSEVRLQVAQAMQQKNLKLKLGAFQIDMRDGEVLFLLQHHSMPKDKERCVTLLAVLFTVCQATYNQSMEPMLASIAAANPGVKVDSEPSAESALLKLLLETVGDSSGSSGGSSGTTGKSADEAQIRLIMQLLALAKSEGKEEVPLTGPATFTPSFKKDMESFLLSPQDIAFEKTSDSKKVELGRGSFGVVYKGILMETFPVAIKQIQYKGHSTYETFKQEAKIMKQMSNSYVVTFCGVAIIDKQLHVVSEFCNQGSLQNYMEKNAITTTMALSLAKEAAAALNYLHKKKFIHRDVKPGNFLVHDNHLKLADFGLTLLVQNSNDEPAAGTVCYLAPEICLASEITTKVDVFAYGIVLWELLHPGQQLYPTIRSLKEYTLKVAQMQHRMEISPKLPLAVSQLIQECWAHEPDQRPTMTQVFFRLEMLQKEYAQSQVQQDQQPTAQTQPSIDQTKAQTQPVPPPQPQEPDQNLAKSEPLPPAPASGRPRAPSQSASGCTIL